MRIFFYKKTYKFLLLAFIFFLLNGCTLPEIENIKKDINVYPFETVVLSPKIKDEPLNEFDVKYEQLSGRPLKTLYTKYKTLHIKVPSDIGKDENFTFRITVSKGLHKKSIKTTLHLKTKLIKVIETEDDGYPDDCDEKCQKEMDNQISDFKIIQTSIKQRGIYESSSDEFFIKFKSESGAQFDFFDEYADITLNVNADTYDIKEYFTLDKEANILKVKDSKLDDFKNFLKSKKGLIRVFLNLYDKQEKSINYIINFHYGFATIIGSLQDDKTKKGITYLENSLIEITDSKKHFSYETYLDKNGNFRVENIPAGFYFISFYTMNGKYDAWNHLDIYGKREIYTMILYINKDGSKIKNRFVQEKIINKYDDINFERMQYIPKSINIRAFGDNIGSISVVSAAQNQEIKDTKTIHISKEIKNFKIKATISSDEFPKYTQAQSKFNDLWKYHIKSDTNSIQSEQKVGKVNDTHVSSKSIIYEYVYKNTVDGTNVTITASSTNIGDGVLPTSVTLEVIDVNNSLSIEEFIHLNGLGKGKNSNNYHIGLSKNSAKLWKAKVTYLPKDAKLIKAKCFLETRYGNININNVEILENKANSAILQMGFKNNSTFYNANKGVLKCNFEAKYKGNDLRSAIATSMKLLSNNDTLYILQQSANINRFGLRDTGGDNWLRQKGKNYLDNSTLIYNDASREHGGCFVKNKYYSKYNTSNINCNIKIYRDHASHRDGTSVDARYPTATYTDPTKGLKTLYNKFKVIENNETNITDDNNTKEIISWVKETRNNIDKIVKSNDVKLIYIDNSLWFKKLLIYGKDKNNKPIPSLNKWSKSSAIIPLANHLNHMHIEFNK